MRQRGDSEIMLLIVALFAFIAAVMGGAMWMDSEGCKSRWKNAGMKGVTWGPVQGCLVQLPDGRWLPASNLREVDIPKEPR